MATWRRLEAAASKASEEYRHPDRSGQMPPPDRAKYGWSAFDQGAESGQGGVPLPRDLVEAEACVGQALLVEAPAAFAAVARAADQAGTFHDAQVLGDGLARDFRTGREPGNGHWSLIAQASHKAQSSVVSQCREDLCGNFCQDNRYFLRDSSQDIPRSAWLPAPSRPRLR